MFDSLVIQGPIEAGLPPDTPSIAVKFDSLVIQGPIEADVFFLRVLRVGLGLIPWLSRAPLKQALPAFLHGP